MVPPEPAGRKIQPATSAAMPSSDTSTGPDQRLPVRVQVQHDLLVLGEHVIRERHDILLVARSPGPDRGRTAPPALTVVPVRPVNARAPRRRRRRRVPRRRYARAAGRPRRPRWPCRPDSAPAGSSTRTGAPTVAHACLVRRPQPAPLRVAAGVAPPPVPDGQAAQQRPQQRVAVGHRRAGQLQGRGGQPAHPGGQLVGAHRDVEPDAEHHRGARPVRLTPGTSRRGCRRTCRSRSSGPPLARRQRPVAPAGRWATSGRRPPRRPGAPRRPAPRRRAAAATRTPANRRRRPAAARRRLTRPQQDADRDAGPRRRHPRPALPAAPGALPLRDDDQALRLAGPGGLGRVGVRRAGLGAQVQAGPEAAGHQQRAPQRPPRSAAVGQDPSTAIRAPAEPTAAGTASVRPPRAAELT